MEQLLQFYLDNPHYVGYIDPHTFQCICEYAKDPKTIENLATPYILIKNARETLMMHNSLTNKSNSYFNYSPLRKKFYKGKPVYDEEGNLKAVFEFEIPFDKGEIHFKNNHSMADAFVKRKSTQLYPHPGDRNGKIGELTQKIHELPEFSEKYGSFTEYSQRFIELSLSITLG